MRRRQLLLALGAGVTALVAHRANRGGPHAQAPLLTPAVSRIRQELGPERCRELLAAAAADPTELASRIEADLRSARILFVDTRPCTHTELAAALRSGQSR